MEKDNIEEMLSYAAREGFLDSEDVENWTDEQKKDYYNKCLAYEPEYEIL